VEFCGYAFGKSYNVAVTREALTKTPVWDESRAENPPLSAQRALKLATEFRKTLIPDPAKWKWEMEYLGLRQIYGRWYWLAHFEALPTHAAFSGVAPDLYVAVLMDGTVVKPHVQDERPYHR
jgi:hypothetical protein